jgi:hypothetical protein
MFQQPSQGDQVKVADLLGSLTLIWARDYREDVTTAYGPADAVAVDIHVLDGPQGGEKFENTLLFQRALIGSLRSAIGGEPVLARIGQGVAKPGQSPPYILLPYTPADEALATSYMTRMPKPFQAAGNGSAAPVDQYTNDPTALRSTPTGAVDAATFNTLPPEVQELLRQTGAAPVPF